ncbi:raftlin [Alosa pseudoharengus]|uniref:raftlin n=1 Tax=Alosa pseudoharengus TaxID=34774 RepID=UPI003F8B8B38
MGCNLPKGSGSGDDVISPGRIQSTVRKTQIHSQGGVAYTYHFLDFLLGKEDVGVSSLLCLSSVRELPVQVREWCGRGYELVAVHPFVHSCSPEAARMYRSLHRAVLIKEANGSEKRQECCLETDVCFCGHQVPDPEVFQNYMKKVQDQAAKGLELVGLLQQPGGGPCFPGHWNSEELSSLHSTPSPVHSQSEQTQANQSESTSPDMSLGGGGVPGVEVGQTGPAELDSYKPGQSDVDTRDRPDDDGDEQNTHDTQPPQEKQTQNTHITLNNNNVLLKRPEDCHQTPHTQNRVQLFALYRHTENLIGSQRFYSVRIPLQLQWEAGFVTGVDAHWLDHMNQHFLNGASLIDGFLCLVEDTGTPPSSVQGVFIFQAPPDDAEVTTSYDAIVVEQWTVIEGVAVKVDYTPLLLSLAPFGWRLMCVLPTPLIRTNSDGSLATKQILFLQRPVQVRRRERRRGEEDEEEADGGEMEEEETGERKEEMIKEEGKNQESTKSAEGVSQSEPLDEREDGVATEDNQEVGGASECTNQDGQSKEEELKQEEEVRQYATHALFSGVC